jgi:serine phosphatase RsbU (regulator of sigma subunit)/anti-sigma regulatory factor (Ser/Thr protein kinase)
MEVARGGSVEQRLALLGEAATSVGTTLDVVQTAQELADLAVPLFADYVTVDLAESVPQGGEPPARLGPGGRSIPVFRRTGMASVHEGFPESLWALGDQVFVPVSSPFTWVLSSGRSYWEPVMDTSRGTWLDQDPARARVIRGTGMHSLMILPILARGAVLGVAVFVRTDNPEAFKEEDLLLAEQLVARAGLALDNARRFTREHATALALQRNLLPRTLCGGTAVTAASRYLPADSHSGVGGDWFDVIPLSSARVALVVGDVVGHGIHAAAAMGRLRVAMRTLADLDLPPDELLARLDDIVIRLGEEENDSTQHDSTTTELGATCLYIVYDPMTRLCTMARAGHPPPAICRPDGTVTFAELPPGAPLGLGLLTFESVQFELPEDSVIVLYTDGLIETPAHDLSAGMRRLAATLRRSGLSLEDLCTAVTDALPVSETHDDAALLLARTHVLQPGQIASWELPSHPSVVSRARSLVVDQLTRWGLPDLAATTELLASELVTNAIRHGTGPIVLRLIRHQVLVCEVTDSSDSSPRLRHARATDESGRGLFLVAQVSHRWGTRYTPDGKVIWSEQKLPVRTDQAGREEIRG